MNANHARGAPGDTDNSELECSAGGILLVSDSECDAAVSVVGEFDVTVAEILQ